MPEPARRRYVLSQLERGVPCSRSREHALVTTQKHNFKSGTGVPCSRLREHAWSLEHSGALRIRMATLCVAMAHLPETYGNPDTEIDQDSAITRTPCELPRCCETPATGPPIASRSSLATAGGRTRSWMTRPILSPPAWPRPACMPTTVWRFGCPIARNCSLPIWPASSSARSPFRSTIATSCPSAVRHLSTRAHHADHPHGQAAGDRGPFAGRAGIPARLSGRRLDRAQDAVPALRRRAASVCGTSERAAELLPAPDVWPAAIGDDHVHQRHHRSRPRASCSRRSRSGNVRGFKRRQCSSPQRTCSWSPPRPATARPALG